MACEPTSSCMPVIKNVLSVLSKKDVWLSPILWLAVVFQVLEENVPPVYVEPACKFQFIWKLLALSSSNAPEVSAAKS